MFDDRWPKKMRSFDEEMRVLDKREGWRRMKSVFVPCGVMYYTSRDQRIYRGEELPRCLLFDDTRIKESKRLLLEKTTQHHEEAVRHKRAGLGEIRRNLSR